MVFLPSNNRNYLVFMNKKHEKWITFNCKTA